MWVTKFLHLQCKIILKTDSAFPFIIYQIRKIACSLEALNLKRYTIFTNNPPLFHFIKKNKTQDNFVL